MSQKAKIIPSLLQRSQTGQALIEYALILVLVALALVAALIATGPAIANVFSNTVCNLVGLEDCAPESLADRGGGPENFWLTVTAVALNPPKEEPIPTNIKPPPTPKPTEGPSPTPTEITPSPTPNPTATDAPTATPRDFGFDAPHIDPIDEPQWWRVDSSVYLGGEDWWGEYYPNKTLSGTPEPQPAGGIWNYQIDRKHKFNINFDWGAGAPLLGWSQVDNFSVRWTRIVQVTGTQDITLSATITSIGGVRFWVDSELKLNDWTDRTLNDPPLTTTFTLSPGNHIFKLEYYVGTGDAAVFLNLNHYKGQVRDDRNLASGDPSCQWTRITGSQPNTVAWAWKESPGGTGTGFPPNMRCHLELRGYVDVSKLTAPKLSFWDVWDLGGGGTVSLQIAEYAPYVYVNPGAGDGVIDPTSGPKWAEGVTVQLHNGGRNYAWTHNIIDIPDVPSKRVAFRFILDSGGAGAGNRRWYLDDIFIANQPTRTFTVCTDNTASCGNYWNLDNDAQKADFITTGRWAITTTNPAGSTGSGWDVSGGAAYVRFGAEQPSGQANDNRVHSIEFNGPVVLQNMNSDGTGGIPDWEGHDGVPLLRFYQAYDIETGTSLEIQYTRDPYGTTPANWQTLQVLAVGPRTDLTMQQTEVDLSGIPNWWQSPFRLRFAMKVDNSRVPAKPGWWIDNIAFARKGIPRYSPYPFCDGGERQGMDLWLSAGGWGLDQPGAFGSPLAFADSPGTRYRHGMETWMELRYPLDLNNDTPENLDTWGGNKHCEFGTASGAAAEPILSFWHRRDLAASEVLYVDIARPANSTSGTTRIDWTPVWSYVYQARTGTQLAWERAEINLRAAILDVIQQRTGVTMTWEQLKLNADPYDDDFYFRFRLDARTNSAVANGVYIDNIGIYDYTEVSHRLWDISQGGDSSRFTDNVDNPVEWWLRWYAGGDWSTTVGPNWQIADPPMPYWWKARSGTAAFHDSPPPSPEDSHATPYKHATFSVLEMQRIIDLTNVQASNDPTLYFWNHYHVGNRDAIRVEIAIQDSTRTRMGYDYIHGWGSNTAYSRSSSWQIAWSRAAGSRVDTWVREQIDLSGFAGRRIRIRFVVDALEDASGLGYGWFIDDIRIEHNRPRVMPFPFIDQAKNTQNWITEGLWGLAPDIWRGSGGGPANLGPDTWKGYFMKCTNMSGTIVNCSTANARNFLDRLPHTIAGMNAYVNANIANGKALPMYESNEIEFDFGSTGRPPGVPLGPEGAAWDNDFTGRWIRTISVLDGEYTFITTSDDGVRMRYEPIDEPASGAPYNWNIINNWSEHGRAVDMKTVPLQAGEYKVVVEWFERSGDAVIIVQAGNNSFSFSDSPRPSPTSDIVYSVPFGNSSLLLDGLLNLNAPAGMPSSLWIPKLEYYTLYDFASGTSARVEVSIDGGFTWTQNNLHRNCPSGASCSATISGETTRVPPSDWQWRVHDLRSYANRPGNINFLNLRFRLTTLNNTWAGWWITDISVNN